MVLLLLLLLIQLFHESIDREDNSTTTISNATNRYKIQPKIAVCVCKAPNIEEWVVGYDWDRLGFRLLAVVLLRI